MEITLKNNDSYIELCKITTTSTDKLKSSIIWKLQRIGFLSDPQQEVGKTINQIIEEFEEFTLDEIVVELFPSTKHFENIEIKEFVSSLVVWGDSYDHPCSECGCEMKVESHNLGRKKWNDYSCTNNECDGGYSNEPDWGHK